MKINYGDQVRGGELGSGEPAEAIRSGAVAGKNLKGETMVVLGGCVDLMVSHLPSLTTLLLLKRHLETQVHAHNKVEWDWPFLPLTVLPSPRSLNSY